MAKKKSKASKKIGLPPGTLQFHGEKKLKTQEFKVIEYDQSEMKYSYPKTEEELNRIIKNPRSAWIHLSGLHDVELIQQLGRACHINPMILEDILNTEHRPKLEIFDDMLFCVIKYTEFDSNTRTFSSEQVSIVMGKNYIVSISESDGKFFEAVRERMKNTQGRIRRFGADYLFYALIDLIVDYYFLAVENFEFSFEQLEDEVMKNNNRKLTDSIHRMKKEIIAFRRDIAPLREVVNLLKRESIDLIGDDTEIFLNDLYDHVLHILDAIDFQRDMIAGLMDTYYATVSNHMNEVMKVLTIIATIFIPLSFFAGLYGMNFEYMPELHYRWGYFVLLGFMIVVSAIMLTFFRKKRWF